MADITLFEKYTDENRYNILRPSESVMVPNPYQRVYAEVIQFEEADTYPVSGRAGLALNSRAIARVAAAAGISFVSVKRTDDGRDRDYCEVEVLAVMKRSDGQVITTTGKKAVDVKSFSEKEQPNVRKFRLERAETGAKNRAIRQLMALKSSYTREELARPFVVPQITIDYNAVMQDPGARAMLAQQALQSAVSVFGSSQGFAQALPAPEIADPAPALPSPSEFTPTEVVEDLDARIATLLNERDHGLRNDRIADLKTATDERKRKGIAFLESKPVKAGSVPSPAPARGGWKPSEKHIKHIYGIAFSEGIDADTLHDLIALWYNGITSVNDLTREQYDELCGDDENGVDGRLETYAAQCAAYEFPL